MKAIGFIGLTIEAEEANKFLDIHYLGPVQAGDIPTAIAEFNPQVIVIIDGLFRRTASVLHKDILYAISRGITVFGAASIGALRAAELYEYGMKGVGKIYFDYLSGHLTGDDEVAVTTYFVPASYSQSTDRWIMDDDSDALVNIRATLENALGLIDTEPKKRLLSYAKKLCFIDRRWSTLLDPKTYGYTNDPYLMLRKKLANIRVNQKKIDAISCLNEVKIFLNSDISSSERDNIIPKGPFWDETLWSRPLSLVNSRTEVGNEPLLQDLLDYVILSEDGHSIFRDSLIRTLLLEMANILGVKAKDDDIRLCLETFKKVNDAEVPQMSPLTNEECYSLAADEVVCEYLLDSFNEKLQRGILLTLLSEGHFVRKKKELLKLSELASSLSDKSESDLLKNFHAYLGAMGIEDTKDYFERYLSWQPQHRLLHTIKYILSGQSEVDF